MSIFPEDLPEIARSDALPHRGFLIAGIIIFVIVFVREYAEIAIQAIGLFPKSVCALYLFGAYVFVYVCILITVELETASRDDVVVQLVRSSLILGASFMLIAPLLVLYPKRKITVKTPVDMTHANNHIALRKLVGGAQRKESRYTALLLFCLVVVGQFIVLYSLALVLWAILELETADVVGICACYVLLTLFYLVAFFQSMTKLPVVLFGINPVESIRKHMQWLSLLWYLYAYVIVYTVKMILALVTTCFFFAQDMRNYKKHESPDDGAYALSIVFFILTLFALGAFAIFLLVEAFRVEKKAQEDTNLPLEEQRPGGMDLNFARAQCEIVEYPDVEEMSCSREIEGNDTAEFKGLLKKKKAKVSKMQPPTPLPNLTKPPSRPVSSQEEDNSGIASPSIIQRGGGRPPSTKSSDSETCREIIGSASKEEDASTAEKNCKIVDILCFGQSIYAVRDDERSSLGDFENFSSSVQEKIMTEHRREQDETEQHTFQVRSQLKDGSDLTLERVDDALAKFTSSHCQWSCISWQLTSLSESNEMLLTITMEVPASLSRNDVWNVLVQDLATIGIIITLM
eukprot:gene6125-9185_t